MRLVPFDLNEEEVRRKLMGKIIKLDDDYFDGFTFIPVTRELIITGFCLYDDEDGWLVVTSCFQETAKSLLENFGATFDDGTPFGQEILE